MGLPRQAAQRPRLAAPGAGGPQRACWSSAAHPPLPPLVSRSLRPPAAVQSWKNLVARHNLPMTVMSTSLAALQQLTGINVRRERGTAPLCPCTPARLPAAQTRQHARRAHLACAPRSACRPSSSTVRPRGRGVPCSGLAQQPPAAPPARIVRTDGRCQLVSSPFPPARSLPLQPPSCLTPSQPAPPPSSTP